MNASLISAAATAFVGERRSDYVIHRAEEKIMQPHLVKYLAALLTGLSLTLAPALPNSAQGSDTSATQALISEENVG
ncbi:hypothetical protein ACIBKY_32630 [Nonomuraea sp. NPDC050394]|uniref:hypothetical protein n=1 Tax=Nonomuraea sp. NPDC050394 TaxID=3364363 RepID=UPI0037A0528A